MSERRLAALERAALVGLVTGSRRRADAEQSLDELDGLAHAAGATTVVRALQERATPDSATFIGRGKAQALALGLRRGPCRRRDRRQRAHAGAAARAAGSGRLQGHRSHAAHPRHLRPAGPHPRGQAAGRAGAAAVPAAAAGRRQLGAVAARRRHRHPRPGRDQARDGPAADPHANQGARRRDRAGAPAARPAARAPRQERWCRPWRWSATPTPARPRCSTA